MGNDELTALAGDAGSDVLEGAQAAIDDLERAGIIAKEAEEAEATASQEAESVASADLAPAETKDKPDLTAMKDAIEKLAQERREAEAEAPNAEVVQLREMVVALRQEISDLAARIDAQAQVQAKEAAAWKELSGRMAAVEKEHDLAMEVVTGLYDLVMDFYTGKKEVVVERSGSGSAHDPEGKKLQEQINQLVAPTVPVAGQYAGDVIFGGK